MAKTILPEQPKAQPKTSTGKRKFLQVQVSEDELKTYEGDAKNKGISLSEHVRSTLADAHKTMPTKPKSKCAVTLHKTSNADAVLKAIQKVSGMSEADIQEQLLFQGRDIDELIDSEIEDFMQRSNIDSDRFNDVYLKISDKMFIQESQKRK